MSRRTCHRRVEGPMGRPALLGSHPKGPQYRGVRVPPHYGNRPRWRKKRTPTCRGFAKGWFPKGWFWRMFPRNENRNEGTFAKTTLLETALLSPNNPFWGFAKGSFPKGWFRRMFPRNENRNEGTFAKTTLLRNRPSISR